MQGGSYVFLIGWLTDSLLSLNKGYFIACRHIAAPADSSVAPTRTTTSVECMEIATPPQHTTLGEDFDSTGDEGDTPRSRVSVSLPTWFLYIAWVLAKSRHLHRQIFPQAPRALQLAENLGTLVW